MEKVIFMGDWLKDLFIDEAKASLSGGGTGGVDTVAREQISELSQEIADLKNEDVITMKGEIITFSTVAGKPVRINAETSETVKLIHAGKNLLPRPLDNLAETTKAGITGTPHEDGSITFKGEATGTATFFLMFPSFGTERVFPAGKYYLSAKYDGTLTTKNGGDPIYTSINCRLEKLTADGKYTAVIDEYLPFGASFELTEPTTLRAFSSVGMTSVVDAVAYYQIEAGEKPTDWEPPVRNVNEVTFPVDIEAIEGANTVYTENGLMLTATSDMGEKQQILDEAKAMLENRLAGATDFTTVKTLVFGDSISADYYGTYRKWVTALIDCGFFAQDKVTNSSVHATGFVARYNNEANDFISRAAAIEGKDTYDLVVVFGGINDAIVGVPMGETGGDILTQFKPAVDYFFNYMINNFTQAKIVVLSPLRIGADTQTQYTDYIKQVAKSYSLPVLNLTDESGFCPSIDAFKNRWTFTGYNGSDGVTGDGVHPNEEYERRFLAPMIRAFLQSVM
jgi:lysophospholipase L1-like esterase